MEPLTWTGPLGVYLNPVFQIAAIALIVSAVAMIVRSFGPSDRAIALAGASGNQPEQNRVVAISTPAVIVGLILGAAAAIWSGITKAPVLGMENGWTIFLAVAVVGTVIGAVVSLLVFQIPENLVSLAVMASGGVLLASIVVYMLAGVLAPFGTAGILGELSSRLLPVWVSLIVLFVVSIRFKRRLGLYGKLFDSPVGMIGFGLVMFWVFTAAWGDWIMTHDPLAQVSGMKNKLPGTPVRGEDGAYYLLGGDNLARDIWSRLVAGSRIVLSIAPAATAFAFMVGITLGLPAGYFGGRFDTILSFLANLVLAFPVILLFYLLVTPEIRQTGVVTWVAAVLFIFPVIFFWVLMYSRWRISPRVLVYVAAPVVAFLLMVYFGTVFEMDPFVGIWTTVLGYLNQGNPIGEWMAQTWNSHEPLVSLGLGPEKLNIFVSVVFVNSPTIFRIVRGLTLDIQTRDYVAAAQTRGEGPWYIMLWEILPNARGPLIVDFCLRIGYTTILLGTLGFFGLGLSPESPDWGTMINDGRKLLTIYVHPALPPALALMSMVLGLNLLADGLREESLKD